MEQVHGVDVRWMTQGSFKDKTSGPSQPVQLSPESQTPSKAQTTSVGSKNLPDRCEDPVPANGSNGPARQPRSEFLDKSSIPPGNGATPPHPRRSSWFSNISAKFSGGPLHSQTAAAPPRSHSLSPGQQPSQSQYVSPLQSLSETAIAQPEIVVPRIPANRNAVLQHASIPEGDGPYTPAPPKSGQAGFLGVFRRLSAGGAGNTPTGKLAHGLVERRVLNVDRNRERCPISELKDNKLRRVSFCVDVEIAPMPRYTDTRSTSKSAIDNTQRKMAERGEGEALKNPIAAEAQKEAGRLSSENLLKDETQGLAKKDQDAADPKPAADTRSAPAPKETTTTTTTTTTRKKEKKKKSEAERKARKEKRRKLAEANGSVPVEIQYDESDSSDSPDSVGSPKTTCFPTTNPVRIYRRCCQLRESPILKKITEQLNDSANTSATTGYVNKLDLTGYFMQLQDLITLGDYLAVVPVREVILDGSGLTDEGLRVILAGLLAAKQPEVGRRRHRPHAEQQGGVVERLSIKDNNLGTDGWKYIALFVYMSRSLKQLDLSKIPFPRETALHKMKSLAPGMHHSLGIADIFAKSLAERPAGSTLEMVNIGETEPSTEQLGIIIDGMAKCGVSRLGVANNKLDQHGLRHVAKYLEAGKCEGLDIGGNDLRDHMDILAASIKESDPLWAISLAGCNLVPCSLCRIFPVLTRLPSLRFIDLSHNHDLFDSKPSAVGVLRRCLPQMDHLKRIHLRDVNMTAEQAIALVEVVPEVHSLAHINLLENPELARLADAKTEEAKEEACALYASLMAASRISKSMICVDIDVPSAEATEIVKAMAKQVVAYCLRNMELTHHAEVGSAAVVAAAAAEAHGEWKDGSKPPSYPSVIAHLVGHDVFEEDSSPVDDDNDDDAATADENYVIGGTGVVKALTFCLANRSDDSRSINGMVDSQDLGLPTGGKAKDLSKHLLAGARKIRLRLQPALSKAKANPSDEINLRKLVFLDETLQGIIKRFEDEFPDTRETAEAEASTSAGAGTSASGDADADAAAHPDEAAAEPAVSAEELEQSLSVPPVEDSATMVSDGDGDVDDETKIHVAKPLSRTNSQLSKVLAEEEGRVHRAGHRFRLGVADTADGVHLFDDIGEDDPNQVRVLNELAEDIGGELLEKVKEKGVIRAFKEHQGLTVKSIKESDLEYWPRFVESQRKAQANIKVPETRQQVDLGGSAVED
ncbi:MAP-homologous protein 1 [Escovopsis weberi]|uniref:MAP-homologous protein 1 n=1 Tax=Escovopsis weberi TaxID=150374 RepID=A0A0M9VV04_ESCWE|nr:MAP-homologous protein 1 [Escovopsis weberi]